MNQPTASLTTESSGNGYTLTNDGVVSANDATYGDVAFFDGVANTSLRLNNTPTHTLGANPRTVSTHIRFSSFGTFLLLTHNSFGILFLSDSVRIVAGGTVEDYPYSFQVDTWYHFAVTQARDTFFYINGLLENSFKGTTKSEDALMMIGSNIFGGDVFHGFISDFRMYDAVLSGAEVASLHAEGPNPIILPPFYATMYTHVANLVWAGESGASAYTLTFSLDSGPETTITDMTELYHSFFDLTPGSSYVFNVFPDLNPSVPLHTTTETAPIADATTVGSLMERLGSDLTLLEKGLRIFCPWCWTVLALSDSSRSSHIQEKRRDICCCRRF